MILTTPFAGRPAVDEGADAFLARVPWAVDLARKVSLGRLADSPSVGKAAVYWNRLHDIPEGLLLGMPTGSWPWRARMCSRCAASSVPASSADAAHRHAPDSIGKYVRSRFGNEVHERLVDPLIGSIYAPTPTTSASTPSATRRRRHALAQCLDGSRHRPQPPTRAGVLRTDGGSRPTRPGRVDSGRRRGGDVRCNAAVEELAADGATWRLNGASFDGVVLACPGTVASGLLAAIEADVASTLARCPRPMSPW
jgi:oxygen-dependent protoporphyrinogen oxidase